MESLVLVLNKIMQTPWFWIVGAILLWLVIREFMTWYWKVNEMVTLLKKIEENTRKTQ